MSNNIANLIKFCSFRVFLMAIFSWPCFSGVVREAHGHPDEQGRHNAYVEHQVERDSVPHHQGGREPRGGYRSHGHEGGANIEPLEHQGESHGHPLAGNNSRGDYYHSGRHYNYYHNGNYYNYYHNDEYYQYFIDGDYYNYFYRGAYYVYFVNGRYYNYFYNGAYYQDCRRQPGYRFHGRWHPSTMVCH